MKHPILARAIVAATAFGGAGAGAVVVPVPSVVRISGEATFGILSPGATLEHDFTLRAVGNPPTVPVTIASAAVTGSPAFKLVSAPCTNNVCTAAIAFNAPLGGDYAATLQARTSNGGRGSIALFGHGYGPSFAWVAPGVASGRVDELVHEQVVLKSTGETALLVSRFQVDDPSGRFSVGSTTCVGMIQPGATCSVDIRFNALGIESDLTVETFAASISPVTNSGTIAADPLSVEVSVPVR